MTNPDQAADKALQAANSIASQVGRLWQSAHHDGLRDGIEVAAQTIDLAGKEMADNCDLDPTVRDLAAVITGSLRDQLRLLALTLPDPDPIDFGTAANDA